MDYLPVLPAVGLAKPRDIRRFRRLLREAARKSECYGEDIVRTFIGNGTPIRPNSRKPDRMLPLSVSRCDIRVAGTATGAVGNRRPAERARAQMEAGGGIIAEQRDAGPKGRVGNG